MARQIARDAEANGWTYLCPRHIDALGLASSDLLSTLLLALNTNTDKTWQYEVENKEISFQRD